MFRLLFVFSYLIFVLGSFGNSQSKATNKTTVTGTKDNSCERQAVCCKDGKDGKDGLNGRDGRDGLNGNNGRDGQNGKDGRDGRDGKPGTKGEKGKPGITKEILINNVTQKGEKGEQGAPGPKGMPGTCDTQSSSGSSGCSMGFHFFEKLQDLPSRGAASVKHHTIAGNLYLAISNHYGDVKKRKTGSAIYKMNTLTDKFALYQTLPTRGSSGLEFFSIAGKHFLATTNHYDGTYQLDSVIYQWNGKSFVDFQRIRTSGATKVCFIDIEGEKYLVVTNSYDGSTHSIKSVVYQWKNSKFDKFQEVATEGAFGCTAFKIDKEAFVAFANYYNAQQKYSVQSTVFKWSGGHFVRLQSLQSYGARDVKSFNINGHTFLAFANFYSGSSYNIDSFIYKWNGNNFVLFQSFPTRGGMTIHPFVISGQTYLGVANHHDSSQKYNTQSVVYQASGARFIKYQEFPTHGAHGMTSFEYKGHTYLAVANYYNSQSRRYNINSALYKWM